MYKQIKTLLAALLLPFVLLAQPRIQLDQYATGFDRPIDIAHCGDSRLFIVEQDGRIWILDSMGVRLPTPFLNIDPQVNSSGNEQGLLGLAFHPNYAQNGWFYVNYIRSNGDTRISRYTVSATDPNVADPASERILLNVDQPYSNHNGGCMKFGADGMLYISLGDGGSGGDPQNYSQRKNTHLGKMLRLDVNTDVAPYYTVPPTNPFVNDAAYFPEIWSLGLRNVWRFSFDRLNGDMWMGDVGQNSREEINHEPANTGGRNYGWRCYEGNNAYNTSGCNPQSSYTGPVFDYAQSNANGCSVTGGFVYRGSQYPDMYGYYLFADYCSGRFWQSSPNGNGGFSTAVLANLSAFEYSSFGEDRNGELYVAMLSSGHIMKIREICSAFQASAVITPATCDGALNGIIELSLTGATGTPTYSWSNGQDQSTIVYLNPGTYTVTIQNGNQCVRTATYTVGATSSVIPTVVASSTVLCNGQNVALSTTTQPPAGYNYQWYNNGQAIPNANQSTLSVAAVGSYTLAFVDAVCNLGASTPIAVSELTAPTITMIQGQAVNCANDTVVLQSSPAPAGFGYQWNDGSTDIAGATAQTYRIETPAFGNYSVYLTGPGGCQSNESNQILVDYEITIPPSISYVEDTLTLEFVDDPNAQWFLNGQLIPGATGSKYKPLVTGQYTVEFTTANGCEDAVTITLNVLNAPVATAVLSCTITPNPTTGMAMLDLRLKQSEPVRIELADPQGRLIRQWQATGQQISQPIDLSGLPAATYFLTLKLGSSVITREVVKQ
jgi:glucose/arabinose dehydrogenase